MTALPFFSLSSLATSDLEPGDIGNIMSPLYVANVSLRHSGSKPGNFLLRQALMDNGATER